MGFSSGEDPQFLLVAIVFACLDLGGSVKVTRYFSDETWLDTIFELLGRGLAVLWWVLVIYPVHCSLLIINLVSACVFDLNAFFWPHYGSVMFYMNLWADLNQFQSLMAFWLSYCRFYLSMWLLLSLNSVCGVEHFVVDVLPWHLMTVH